MPQPDPLPRELPRGTYATDDRDCVWVASSAVFHRFAPFGDPEDFYVGQWIDLDGGRGRRYGLFRAKQVLWDNQDPVHPLHQAKSSGALRF